MRKFGDSQEFELVVFRVYIFIKIIWNLQWVVLKVDLKFQRIF